MFEPDLEAFGLHFACNQKSVVSDTVTRAGMQCLDVDIMNLEVSADCRKQTLLVWSHHFDNRSIFRSLNRHAHGPDRPENRYRRFTGPNHGPQAPAEETPRFIVEPAAAFDDERMKSKVLSSPCRCGGVRDRQAIPGQDSGAVS